MSQARKTARRPPTVSTPTPAAHDPSLVDSMDELLDEIDGILAEEEQFASRFRQRGGQ